MRIYAIQSIYPGRRLICLLSLFISFSTVIPAHGEDSAPVTDDLYYFIANGNRSGDIGAGFNMRDFHSRGPKDLGLAWGDCWI